MTLPGFRSHRCSLISVSFNFHCDRLKKANLDSLQTHPANANVRLELKPSVTTGVRQVKMVNCELVRAICTYMHGFQNNFAQLLSSRRRNAV